jgi:hypothetical protein
MNIPGNLEYESDFYSWYILIPSEDKIILRQVQKKEGENAFATLQYCDDRPYENSIYRDPRVWQRWVRRRDRGKPKPKNERLEAIEAEIKAVEAELKALKERTVKK